MEQLTPKMIATIRKAAHELTGAKRRAFEAQIALDYLGGDPRLTETVFGWSRHTVARQAVQLLSRSQGAPRRVDFGLRAATRLVC